MQFDYDFIVKRQHSFIRNVFDKDDLTPPVVTLKKYYFLFSLFVQVLKFLISHYSEENDIEDIDHNCLADFTEKDDIESLEQL